MARFTVWLAASGSSWHAEGVPTVIAALGTLAAMTALLAVCLRGQATKVGARREQYDSSASPAEGDKPTTSAKVGNSDQTDDSTLPVARPAVRHTGSDPFTSARVKGGSPDGTASIRESGSKVVSQPSICSIELVTQGASVPETVDLLRRVCDVMDGSISNTTTLVPDTIRPGIHAAIANVRSYGEEMTVVFFPDEKRKNRHVKLFERSGMVQIMPIITLDSGATVHSSDGCAVHLPPRLCFGKAESIDVQLARTASAVEFSLEASVIWQQLTQALVTLHRRDIIARDVCKSNVVRVRTGSARTWTLLEFGSVTRPGAMAQSVTARTATPEAAAAVLEGRHTEIRHSFDIWQLGMLIYEVHSGAPYWSRHPSDESVLRCLLDPTAKLPHELAPVAPAVFQKVVRATLVRDPLQRITAPALEALLRAELTKEMPNVTLNPGEVVDEGHRELAI